MNPELEQRGPLLLHSVSYAGLWGQAALPLEAFIEKAAALGYQGVMLMAKRPHLSVMDYDVDACRRLGEILAAKKLSTVCIAGYNNFTADLEHGEVPHQEFQIQHIAELALRAQALGSKVIRVFTGYENPALPLAAQWNSVVSALRECARRVAEFGVVLGVQNHHDIAAGWEQMSDLLAAVNEPNCRAMFDAWAPFLHGSDLAAEARRMGPLTVNTTVADYQLRPRFKYDSRVVNYTPAAPLVQAVPMGEGAIDYRSFLADMQSAGFRGSITYEMCSPLLHGGTMDVLDRYARGFVEYMSGEN